MLICVEFIKGFANIGFVEVASNLVNGWCAFIILNFIESTTSERFNSCIWITFEVFARSLIFNMFSQYSVHRRCTVIGTCVNVNSPGFGGIQFILKPIFITSFMQEDLKFRKLLVHFQLVYLYIPL